MLTEANLYTFGFNKLGQLGDGTLANKKQPYKITDQFKGCKIKRVECIGYHNFVITDKGLYAFGSNCYG